MAAFRKYHWSTSAISSLALSFWEKNFLTNKSGIIAVFCAGGVNYLDCNRSVVKGAAHQRRPTLRVPREECQSHETIIKLKVYVTFKGAVSRRSHSWTHALPSGDITPRLLPWAPVLPLDKCWPLSWGCWTKWQLCHMSGLQDQCPSVPEAPQQQNREFKPCFHASID